MDRADYNIHRKTTGNTITLFIWGNDEGWPIEFVSDNISVYGYAREDFESGKVSFADIVHPDDLDRVAREVYQFTRDKLKCFSQEYRIRTKSGEVRWVRDYTFVRSAADGTTSNYHGVLLDITDYKNALEERRKDDLRKPQSPGPGNINVILESIAHEFNNMFTSILGNAELVLKDMDDSDEKSESLREIRDTTIRAAQLSNKMLHCNSTEICDPKSASPEEPSTPTDNEPPQIKTPPVEPQLVEEPHREREPIEPQPEAKSKLKILEPLSYDQQLMDKGMMDDSTRIDPRFLADALPTERNQPITKVLEAPPARPQPFTFTPPPPAVDKSETVKSDQWRGAGTILVAEDEDSVRQLACKLLGRLGFSVLTANNGQKAVDIFRQNSDKISAVLLDVSMPYLNGNKVLAEMKRIRSNVKAIICSGYSRDMVMGQFTDTKPADFLQKPYQIKELSTKLRKVLEED